MTWILLALAGALGAAARWGLDRWISSVLGRSLPWGILTVNVLGCLALGLLVGAAGGVDQHASTLIPAEAPRVVATGLLGSFTTFSTVFVDAVRMCAARRLLAAAGYLALTFALGIAALLAGLLLPALLSHP